MMLSTEEEMSQSEYELDSDSEDIDQDTQLGLWLGQLETLQEGLGTDQHVAKERPTTLIPGHAMDSYRFSMANLEGSDDIDLDALLNQLCELSTDLSTTQSKLGPPDDPGQHDDPRSPVSGLGYFDDTLSSYSTEYSGTKSDYSRTSQIDDVSVSSVSSAYTIAPPDVDMQETNDFIGDIGLDFDEIFDVCQKELNSLKEAESKIKPIVMAKPRPVVKSKPEISKMPKFEPKSNSSEFNAPDVMSMDTNRQLSIEIHGQHDLYAPKDKSPSIDSGVVSSIANITPPNTMAPSSMKFHSRDDGDSVFSELGDEDRVQTSQLSQDKMHVVRARLESFKQELDQDHVPIEEQAQLLKSEKIKIAVDQIREASVKKLFVQAFTAEGCSKTILVDETMTVRLVINMLLTKNHLDPKITWSLVEYIPNLFMERTFEDHDLLVESMLTWTRDTTNKLMFVEKPHKYDLFKHPEDYLLIGTSQAQSSSLDSEGRRQLIMEYMSDKYASRVPDMDGILNIKATGKKAWRKCYCVLRASGIYYNPRGKTKTTKDLVCLQQLDYVEVYSGYGWKKKFRAPTDFCFALKHPQVQKKSQYIKYFCADDIDSLHKWVTTIRIAKFGRQLLKNYRGGLDSFREWEDTKSRLSHRGSFLVQSLRIKTPKKTKNEGEFFEGKTQKLHKDHTQKVTTSNHEIESTQYVPLTVNTESTPREIKSRSGCGKATHINKPCHARIPVTTGVTRQLTGHIETRQSISEDQLQLHDDQPLPSPDLPLPSPDLPLPPPPVDQYEHRPGRDDYALNDADLPPPPSPLLCDQTQRRHSSTRSRQSNGRVQKVQKVAPFTQPLVDSKNCAEDRTQKSAPPRDSTMAPPPPPQRDTSTRLTSATQRPTGETLPESSGTAINKVNFMEDLQKVLKKQPVNNVSETRGEVLSSLAHQTSHHIMDQGQLLITNNNYSKSPYMSHNVPSNLDHMTEGPGQGQCPITSNHNCPVTVKLTAPGVAPKPKPKPSAATTINRKRPPPLPRRSETTHLTYNH